MTHSSLLHGLRECAQSRDCRSTGVRPPSYGRVGGSDDFPLAESKAAEAATEREALVPAAQVLEVIQL